MGTCLKVRTSLILEVLNNVPKRPSLYRCAPLPCNSLLLQIPKIITSINLRVKRGREASGLKFVFANFNLLPPLT